MLSISAAEFHLRRRSVRKKSQKYLARLKKRRQLRGATELSREPEAAEHE